MPRPVRGSTRFPRPNGRGGVRTAGDSESRGAQTGGSRVVDRQSFIVRPGTINRVGRPRGPGAGSNRNPCGSGYPVNIVLLSTKHSLLPKGSLR
jgi:hypothetical protein